MAKSTLCWKCQNTCGGCSWTKSFKPVDGWRAKKAVYMDCGKRIESYLVLDCPQFKKMEFGDVRKHLQGGDFFYLFKLYKEELSEDEQKIFLAYLLGNIDDILSEYKISERTFYRYIHIIKRNLKMFDNIQKTIY